MARDITTYVWQTGSLTSSSLGGAAGGGRDRHAAGSRESAMRTTARKARSSSTRIAPSAGVGADGERAEEVAVLLGQVEAFGGLGRASAREEDAGLGAALEDLLHGLPRGLGGLERQLDGAEQLLHQPIRGALLRHGPYASTLTRRSFPCPPTTVAASGDSSARQSASGWASSRCARTSGACPREPRSATRSCTSGSRSGWCRSWMASESCSSASSAT